MTRLFIAVCSTPFTRLIRFWHPPVSNLQSSVQSCCHPSYSLSLNYRPAVHRTFTMSQALSASASTSSSNFQSIFNAALKAYEKKTKKDLLAHPLAVQLQACNSSSDILAVLQDKVNELDQSMSADERLSQWLNPTINVLYSFSTTIGAGVGLVSDIKSACLLLPYHRCPRYSRPRQSSSRVLGYSFR